MFTRVKKSIQMKNKVHREYIRGLVLGMYPEFVYRRLENISTGEIPIFVFHSVKPESLERQIRYLAENNYHTLKADELHDIITEKKKYKKKVVALTFDDGRGSLWSIAYPLLKKYGLNAISFIVPFRLQDEDEYHPNLEDVSHGEYTDEEIKNRDLSKPLCNWNEVLRMHASGIIDFQSHTSHHHTVFTGNRLVDFVNPHLQPSFIDSVLNPVLIKNGKDIVPERFEWGQPIYEWAPAMSVKRRYIEDENLSTQIINFVQLSGGVTFFGKARWHQDLKAFAEDHIKKHGIADRFQTLEERYSEIRRDLLESKLMIEERLNKRVRHLCYPWFKGSKLAVEASKDIGYLCNYWGIPTSKQKNLVGMNSYYLTRISAEFILTLPGRGRIPVVGVLLNKYFKLRIRELIGL